MSRENSDSGAVVSGDHDGDASDAPSDTSEEGPIPFKERYKREREQKINWMERATAAEAEVKRLKGVLGHQGHAPKVWRLGATLYDNIDRYLNIRLTKTGYKFPHAVRTTSRSHKHWYVEQRSQFNLKLIVETDDGDRATEHDLSSDGVDFELKLVTNSGRVITALDLSEDATATSIFIEGAQAVAGGGALVAPMKGGEVVFTGQFAISGKQLKRDLQNQRLHLTVDPVQQLSAHTDARLHYFSRPFHLVAGLQAGPETELESNATIAPVTRAA